jgi:hypothetical protein
MVLFTLVPLALVQARWAQAGCNVIPTNLQSYISSQAGWRLLVVADLGPNDGASWAQDHPNECPGIVPLHFYNHRQSSFGIALVRDFNSILHERLEILTANGKSWTVQRIADYHDQDILALSRVRAGKYTDLETMKQILIADDGLDVEDIEKSDQVYFWSKGRLASLWLSD